MKGRGGRLAWPSSLLVILLVASALMGAIALTTGSDSPAAPGKGTGTQHQEGQGATGNPTAGKTVFQANCSSCHGTLGQGGNGGPDLTTRPNAKDAAKVIKRVTNGGGGMPAFKGQLSQKQISDVAAYVSQKIAK